MCNKETCSRTQSTTAGTTIIVGTPIACSLLNEAMVRFVPSLYNVLAVPYPRPRAGRRAHAAAER